MNTEELLREPESNNVVGVQFSILGPDEIRDRSVVEVVKHETYDKDNAIIKGLFDPRMGTTDMSKLCATCGQNNINCPGHFGHTELARPVYHYQFIQIILKILKCTCLQCSKLLINKDSPKIKNLMKRSNKYRWNEIYAISQKISRCGQETDDGCGAKQPDKLKLDGMDGISAVWNKLDSDEKGTKSQILAIENVKEIFERMTNEDVQILGFSELWCRPEWLICSVLSIPPPAVRPSVKQDDSQRMDDDLTHKLSDIIKCNNTLKQKINTNSRIEVVNDWTKVLQYHIATLIDNELPGIAQAVHRSGRPLKAIRQRLKGKDGRIRNNLMGKRVDFSARSVITPDPKIELDQLGVPESIARNITYPEIINNYNRTKLNTLLENKFHYPGIKLIVKKNGTKITLTESNVNDIELENGDTVHRHLMDGDYVLFNRQPSLHKMSMMGHRVKVMKGNTFRLNISVTPPYNADFDGDEMNMHAPQSISTVSELMNLASVRYQIISPRENKPIITIVQDTLLGINKLTKGEMIHYPGPHTDSYHFSNNTNIYPIPKSSDKVNHKVVETSYFNKTQVMNLLCTLSTFDGTIPDPTIHVQLKDNKVPYWSGKSILSYILPKNINLSMENNSYDKLANDELNKVVIRNGELLSGGVDKSVFTKTSKGLIHTIYNDLGPERTKDFIDDLQKISTYFLLIEGFSVGIGDMIADQDTNQKISDVVKENKKKIENIMQEFHLNIYENYSGKSNKDYFEGEVNSLLNKTLSQTGSIGLENLDQKNRVTNMVNCGSKGKSANVAQIVACLGQQNVDGKRIPYGYIDRTLPHYNKYDDSSEARGFVENSFISGQTPQEYFFHAMGGREGLIDTAVKTSETGYIQRKLMKSMEDLRVDYDYSVRNNSGCIIQFIYGDDGMDSCTVENQSYMIMKMDTDKLCQVYLYDKKTSWKDLLNETALSKMNKGKRKNAKTLTESFYTILKHKEYIFTTLTKNKQLTNSINYPIHIQRFITNICQGKEKVSNISPIEILAKNELLKTKLKVNEVFENNTIIHILIDIYLHPKILINKYKIQKHEYELVVDEIETTFEKSRINPGEMVGAIAAQSIGEPATQMTLNTFHYAGVSAKSNVTRGIPRLRELLGVTKNLKSPSTIIFLNDEYGLQRNKSQYIKNKLEYTVLRDVVVKNQIFYDPKNTIFETEIEDDTGMLEIYKEFLDLQNGPEHDYEETSPWIIRFIFNKELMMDIGIVMEDIYLALMEYDNDRISFTYSDDNSKELIGRVSIKADIPGKEDSQLNGLYDQTDVLAIFKNIQEDILDNVVIKGIQGITNIVMSEKIMYEKVDTEIQEKTTWMLETDGVNLLNVFNSPYIDFTQTFSNDIIEVYEVLGIEAVRELLIEQITDVVEYEGSYINNRHIELLCDIMTNRGFLTAINRQGINRGDIGPLAKCSFEDTTDQLIKAGIFGEKDKLNGVSSNIMLGQVIKAGTGMCDLLLDEEKLIQELENIQLTEEDFHELGDHNINDLMNTDQEDDDYCNDGDFEFSI
uniref:DNA-directed RNA polymerase II subunit RPB1 n=1 Tax=viral metagenome TaxID=1070528 RepID=A0A6C0L177_9ZZZZ|tara:strand:+ start:9245 stop:13816 length:4572 start_codon:yes stop_codon:yes gene_type:complete